ncbi:hypothetical protein RRG08_049884 [Elysia crispata]|uniref:Uncharacterized protein n=1 Tax=Elysia crispata TaxID=231223 RepID=A0AAE1CPQ7_9GAST|nr:hypothetical protein RRG08_049884 [Elysia crispata]
MIPFPLPSIHSMYQYDTPSTSLNTVHVSISMIPLPLPSIQSMYQYDTPSTSFNTVHVSISMIPLPLPSIQSMYQCRCWPLPYHARSKACSTTADTVKSFTFLCLPNLEKFLLF